MTKTIVRFVRENGSDFGIKVPEYQTPGASGADIRANIPLSIRSFGIDLVPNKPTLIPTGFSVQIPRGLEIQIRPRSGFALRHAVSVINSPGTIDSDYRGEVGVIMINLGNKIFHINHGDRIAQIVVAPVIHASFQVVEALEKSDRATRGFGSTGIS
jgi:dUTP pyrophosphatase